MDKNVPKDSVNGMDVRTSETQAHLAITIDNVPGFVYSIDKNFTLITINAVLKDTVRQQFGLDLNPGDSPLKFFETISPSLVEEWRKIYEEAFSGKKLHFVKEFDIINKSFWDFSLTPILQNEEVTGVVCFVCDITEQKLSELKLRESEERYRVVSENPLLCIAWGTSRGKLTNANKAFCDLMEGSLEQLINRTSAEFTLPDDLKPAFAAFEQLRRGEINDYRVEKRYITLKGNIIWVELNITASKNELGELEQTIVVAKDITSKKHIEESLLRSEANTRYILDNSDTACMLLDAEFRILKANRLANEWALFELGIALNEGEEILIHFPEQYKLLAAPVMKKVLEGTAHSYEAKYTKRDNSISWYHLRITPITETKGSIIGLCVVASDITQRKKSEAEIKSLNSSLEKKVAERTTELEEANKELEAFTYSVSHDLLSPLRNIDSFIDVMIEDYRNKLNEEGQHTLGVIKRNSTLMGRLIEDLLNFARFGKVPLRKQLVNMNSVVAEVIDELRFMTNQLSAKIKLQDMHPAYCDPQLVKQVWVNLLSNAVKYSRKKEKPEIEIGSLEEDGQIIYYIKDNGVGFDMQYADKLFGVFQRLHKSGEFEGTGVGLAIVHRIITKHGGRIWANSKAGEGAVFEFVL